MPNLTRRCLLVSLVHALPITPVGEIPELWLERFTSASCWDNRGGIPEVICYPGRSVNQFRLPGFTVY